MRWREWLFGVSLRAATVPVRAEERRDEALLSGGSSDWIVWWSERGERELRCILMTAWDPIGVSDAAEAWDEYDTYLAGVAHRLRDAADDEAAVDAVAEHLTHLERDYMGSNPSQRAAVDLAETLVAWHEFSFVHGGRPPHEWLPD